MADHRRWRRDGSEWHSLAYPGWKIRDTGRKGRRDRYVIIDPEGNENTTWHRAHSSVKVPGLNHAMWSAEARADFLDPLRNWLRDNGVL